MKPNLNGVFIIPTGLDCTFGGDAAFNSGVKLIAQCSKNLIVNPNAVNASDINELASNCLYVEGSTIDRFLNGLLNLKKTRTYNRILMVVNSPTFKPSNINSMNAGIWGLGADITLLSLDTPLLMRAEVNQNGTAGGTYSGVDELVEQVKDLDYDALAIQTPIDHDPEVAANYWNNGGVNPWGGIEAVVSRKIGQEINKPLAHAPECTGDPTLHKRIVVEQSMAPEIISNTSTICILKGLHRAPRIELDLSARNENILTSGDIDFMVSPHGCFGRPHHACRRKGIPIIVVRENTTCFSDGFVYPAAGTGAYPAPIIFVRNYLEAAGVIMSMSCGVDYRTVVL